jgi:cold shock CspA family protein
MNDRILEAHLKDFSAQHGLENQSEPTLFAYFVNHCLLSRHSTDNIPLEDVDVGGGQDSSIDAIAVLISSHVTTSKEDVDFFRDRLGRLDVEFVFIQSKTSPKFDLGDIGNFLFGVKQFFSQSPTVPTNADVKAFREIKEYIYDNSVHMMASPVLRLYFASTGKWCDDSTLMARINADTAELKATNLFSDVKFAAIDAERLKGIYRELKHKVIREINFEKHTILPKIDRVQEAYLGYVPCPDFLAFISDEDGEIQRSLFYDNVRDYQGENPVNSEIAATLNDSAIADKFVLLNNGITIVAKSINKVGAAFRVSDYQIVNGCQTCHVLYRNRKKLSNKVCLPIKLIVTADPEVTNFIIKATNRQTEVKLEAFESLKPFHRKLEEFYASFEKEPSKRLYYERRSKQYDNQPVKPKDIISLATQAKSFLGMFLNEPHSTHRYYGEILEANSDKMFLEEHSPFPYYTAALGLATLESLFRAGFLPSWAKPYRFHLLMLLRLMAGGDTHSPLKGKKADELAEKLCAVLWDKQKALEQFVEATNRLGNRLNAFEGDKYLAPRLRNFTVSLIPNLGERPRGVVKYFDLERGFGFIQRAGGPDIFVHSSAIKGTIHRYLREGENVEFNIIKTPKGLQATDVKLLPRTKH